MNNDLQTSNIDTLGALLAQIADLTKQADKIKDGWLDSESVAADSDAIAISKALVARLLIHFEAAAVPDVFATADGGVQLEWMDLQGLAIDISINRDGGGSMVAALRPGWSAVQRLVPGSVSLEDASRVIAWVTSVQGQRNE